MKLNNQARKMVYECAASIQRNHPDWSNRLCLEDAFIKCAGFNNYNEPLESMLTEYSQRPDLEISKLLSWVGDKDYMK